MRYHLTSVRMGIIKKTIRCRGKGTLVQCWWECKWMQSLWKAVWRFLKKLKIELPYDLAIPLLGIYLKKTKTLIQKDICTPMFIAALFTIAKIWKKSKCPSIDGWIQMWLSIYLSILINIHTHNGILVIKENEILPFATAWMVLEGIILSEISQTKTNPV